MDIYEKTDIGCKRSENQDRVVTMRLDDSTVFAVVCDGMGGENAGSLASEKAIEVVCDRVKSAYRSGCDANSVKSLLINSVRTANAVVHDIASYDESKRGMGTTCVAAIRRGNMAYIVNVGDSRAYVIDGGIVRITKDHTYVMSLYEKGQIRFDELRTHPKRNMLIRAVGVEEKVFPDFFEAELSESGIVLLCSDGLCGVCDDEQILEAVENTPPEKTAEALIELALENGSTDNITAALIY